MGKTHSDLTMHALPVRVPLAMLKKGRSYLSQGFFAVRALDADPLLARFPPSSHKAEIRLCLAV